MVKKIPKSKVKAPLCWTWSGNVWVVKERKCVGCSSISCIVGNAVAVQTFSKLGKTGFVDIVLIKNIYAIPGLTLVTIKRC